MEDFLVSLFIDCTIIPSCRTGGGPMVPGVHAPRYPYLVQEAMYNGWKKCHGIKKQSIGLANGMAFQVSKGYSCRSHDLHLLDKSDINDRLVELTSERPPAEHCSCYGDSAYPQQDRICCKRDGNKFSELNEAMNGCRKSIEWMHRDLTQYWRVPSFVASPPTVLVFSMMLSKRGAFIFCQTLTRSRSAPCIRPSSISTTSRRAPSVE